MKHFIALTRRFVIRFATTDATSAPSVEDMIVRSLIISIIAAPLLLGSLPVLAQGQPSAEQLLQQLRPKGNLINGGTRGIRLAPPGSDAPAPAPMAIPSTQPPPRVASNKPVPVPASPPQQAAPSASLTVNFANGSAELTPEAMQTLNVLGQVLASKDLQGFRFRIEGHTDTVGSRDTIASCPSGAPRRSSHMSRRPMASIQAGSRRLAWVRTNCLCRPHRKRRSPAIAVCW